MANQQHLYRRGPIYWWRRVLTVGDSQSYDARISLRTANKNEARARAGHLTAITGRNGMATLLEDYAATRAADRRITWAQLTKIYRDALNEGVARFVMQQDDLPGHGAINRQLNQTSGDVYQWLIDTDGRTTTVSSEYVARLEARDYDPERIERLKLAVATHAGRQQLVNSQTIEHALTAAGIPVNDTNYRVARQQIWLGYRDALTETEVARLHRAGIGPAVHAPANVPSGEPDTEPGWTIAEAMEKCIEHAKPKGGKGWPSEPQVRTAIRLLVHVTGESMLVSDLRQEHVGAVADLMMMLPNRWGRTREELAGGIDASLKRALSLSREAIGICIATRKKHFTWIAKVVDYASRRGKGPPEKLDFSGFEKDHREPQGRKRDKRALWSVAEINTLLKAPIFTGCLGILDIHRLKAGNQVYHDGWYYGILMFIHLGGRSSEFIGMPMCDVHENAPIPFVEIAVHEVRDLKNEQSQRQIPIHPELIRLGFIDYVRANRLTGETMLFPEMASPDSKSFASTFYKRVFKALRTWAFPNGTTWRHVVGGIVKDKDVYSFRGRAVSEMRAGGISLDIISDILGHEQTTTAGLHYLEVTPLDVMLAAMAHTSHLTADVVAHPLNMRPPELRCFGSTAATGGRPKKSAE